MNYIEYMKGGTSKGGAQDSTEYVTYMPLKTFGPMSSLTFKRNKWLKAIRDAVVLNKTNNAQNPSVATSSPESNNVNDVFVVNTPTRSAGKYISALGGPVSSGLYSIVSHLSRS